MPENETYAERARRKLLETKPHVAEKLAAASNDRSVEWDDDLVPVVAEPDKSAERYEIDAIIDGVDCLDAYNRWSGKPPVDANGKRKNIMVSCPIPGHADKNPSADINLEVGDGVWHCHRCAEGGDKFDIAARHFGYPVPGYKEKDHFPNLRRDMAFDLGYITISSGKDEWLEKAPATPAPAPAPSAPAVPTGPTTSSETEEPEPDETSSDESSDSEKTQRLLTIAETPTFDWRKLRIEENTFLHTWMELMSVTYEPEEFYFFHGLTALAAACGNDVMLDDDPHVRGNLITCVVGATGMGKSISIGRLEDLLHKALPFHRDTGAGVDVLGAAGSGEALLDSFNLMVDDPAATVPGTKKQAAINGVMKDSELAGLAKRMGRHGSTIREVIMDFYDSRRPVKLRSRGAGDIVVRDHFFQLITSTQDESIRRIIVSGDVAAGFVNRVLFVFGTAKKRPARAGIRIEVDEAVEPLQKVRAWGSGGKLVKWHDPPAAELWDKFYDRRIHPLTMRKDEKAFLVARLPLLAKKLMLLFAANDRSTTVHVDHVQNVIDLWPYLLATYGFVEDKVGQNDAEDAANAIIRYMRERPEEAFTAKDLFRSTGARKYGREMTYRAIDTLARGGEIEAIKGPRGGEKYRLNNGDISGTLTVIRGDG